MAVQIISSKRSVLNGTGISIPGQVTYLIDGEEDVAQLPTEGMAVGSQAIAIQEGTTWIFAPSLAWKRFGGSTSTSW